MAYGNYLASVTEKDIELLKNDANVIIYPGFVNQSSHYMAYGLEEEPISSAIGEILDGGKELNPEFYHPLRSPLYFTNEEVHSLYEQLLHAWEVTQEKYSITKVDSYHQVIDLVILPLEHASKNNEYLLSVLDRPFDGDDVKNVQIPFTDKIIEIYEEKST